MRRLVTSRANGGRPLIDFYLVDSLGRTRPRAYLVTAAPTRPVRRSRVLNTLVAVAGVLVGAMAACAGVIFSAMWVLTL